MQAIEIKSYFMSHSNGLLIEDENGVLKAIEYKVNDKDVRFICISQSFDYYNSRASTKVVKQTKNEINEWEKSGEEIILSVNSNHYVDSEGNAIKQSEAFEYVDDLDNEIFDYSDAEKPKSFDPKRYSKKEVLKDGLINEALFMKNLCPALFDVTENRIKQKVSQIYK